MAMAAVFDLNQGGGGGLKTKGHHGSYKSPHFGPSSAHRSLAVAKPKSEKTQFVDDLLKALHERSPSTHLSQKLLSTVVQRMASVCEDEAVKEHVGQNLGAPGYLGVFSQRLQEASREKFPALTWRQSLREGRKETDMERALVTRVPGRPLALPVVVRGDELKKKLKKVHSESVKECLDFPGTLEEVPDASALVAGVQPVGVRLRSDAVVAVSEALHLFCRVILLKLERLQELRTCTVPYRPPELRDRPLIPQGKKRAIPPLRGASIELALQSARLLEHGMTDLGRRLQEHTRKTASESRGGGGLKAPKAQPKKAQGGAAAAVAQPSGAGGGEQQGEGAAASAASGAMGAAGAKLPKLSDRAAVVLASSYSIGKRPNEMTPIELEGYRDNLLSRCSEASVGKESFREAVADLWKQTGVMVAEGLGTRIANRDVESIEPTDFWTLVRHPFGGVAFRQPRLCRSGRRLHPVEAQLMQHPLVMPERIRARRVALLSANDFRPQGQKENDPKLETDPRKSLVFKPNKNPFNHADASHKDGRQKGQAGGKGVGGSGGGGAGGGHGVRQGGAMGPGLGGKGVTGKREGGPGGGTGGKARRGQRPHKKGKFEAAQRQQDPAVSVPITAAAGTGGDVAMTPAFGGFSDGSAGPIPEGSFANLHMVPQAGVTVDTLLGVAPQPPAPGISGASAALWPTSARQGATNLSNRLAQERAGPTQMMMGGIAPSLGVGVPPFQQGMPPPPPTHPRPPPGQPRWSPPGQPPPGGGR